MKAFKLLIPALFMLAMFAPRYVAASPSKHKLYLGTPYSQAYVTKMKKLHPNYTSNPYVLVSLELAVPTSTNFIYWTIDFDGPNGHYSYNTDGYHPADNYYTFTSLPSGVYTVTLHNESYANNYLFDASISYDDSNGQQQYDGKWDVNTDWDDFVFRNLDINSGISISTGPHR